MRRVSQVRKRDGRVVPFDLRRVADAIYRAAQSVGGEDRFLAEELAGVVGLYLERSHAERIPAVEDVEDAVERVLVDTGHAKTAKAFVLRRDRRAAARRSVQIESDDRGERPSPLVTGAGGETLSAWDKNRIEAALVAEAGLAPAAAEEVARAVEDRVLSAGVPRVSSSLVRSLVDAELFARGHGVPFERQRVVGIPKRDLARRIEEGPLDRRPRDPLAFAEAIGEEVLAPYVLEEVVPAAAAEAHRLGEVHLYDLGAPLALTSVTPATEALAAPHLRDEGPTRAGGARRYAAALLEALARHGACAARCLRLEAVNVHWAPWCERLEEQALFEEARELLLSPAVLSFPRRGGLLRLELEVCAEVPGRLAGRPAPRGKTLGDHGDASLRVARAILEAAAAIRRDGGGDRLPSLCVSLPREGLADPSVRALARAALSDAAAAGEPSLHLDESGLPTRGSSWWRAGPEGAADPFRFEAGDLTVATAGAVNLASAALSTAGRGTDAFFAELDRRTALVLEAAAARAEFLAARESRPEGAFFAVAHAGMALVDLEGAAHLVEAVGVDRATAILLPSGGPEERRALRSKVVRRVRARAESEAAARGILAVVGEGVAPDASRRLAAVDAARFHRAASWWTAGEEPVYGPPAGSASAGGAGAGGSPAGAPPRRVPAAPGRGERAETAERTVWRFDASRAPTTSDLYARLEKDAADAAVVELRLDPWPRRVLRGTAAETA